MSQIVFGEKKWGEPRYFKGKQCSLITATCIRKCSLMMDDIFCWKTLILPLLGYMQNGKICTNYCDDYFFCVCKKTKIEGGEIIFLGKIIM